MEKRDIPDQYRSRWELLERELAVASQLLNEANIRYNRVILARISLSQLIRQTEAESHD